MNTITPQSTLAKHESFESLGKITTSTSMLSLATVVEDGTIASSVFVDFAPLKSAIRVPTLEMSLASTDLSTSLYSEQRSIRFDTVEIREHAVILGCNPAVTKGPPLTIGWETLSTSIQSVNEYERNRPLRRSPMFLKLSQTERRSLLKERGFTSEEFSMAESYVEEVKKSRAESASEKSDLQKLMEESKRRKPAAKETKRGLFGRFRRQRSGSSIKA